MKLKSFGCSFIFGTDLADCGIGEPYEKSSQLTWPALLAQDINADYECHARPGCGNLRILEKVLSSAAGSNRDDEVFVVGWTWIDRFDYTVDPTGTDHVYNLATTSDLWKTITPCNDPQATTYYRNLHSQYRDKLSNLIYIKTAIDTLKQKNIQFIMTYMDDLLFETQWHVNAGLVDLQNYVRPCMTDFDGKNFLEFSQVNEYPISNNMHPLELAHQSAFELIKSYGLL